MSFYPLATHSKAKEEETGISVVLRIFSGYPHYPHPNNNTKEFHLSIFNTKPGGDKHPFPA